MKEIKSFWILVIVGIFFIAGFGFCFIFKLSPKTYNSSLPSDYNEKIPLECKTRGIWIGMRSECDFQNFATKSDDDESWCKGNSGDYTETFGDTGPEGTKCIFKLWKFEN
jgi:hypothetical protein